MVLLVLTALAAILGALAYSAWRKAPLSMTFGVAFVVVSALPYLNQIFAGGTVRAAWEDLAVTRGFHADLRPWTYVTSLFLHSGLLHLGFNLIFMLMLGPMVEDRIGSLRWAILFFAGGIVAAVGFQLLRIREPAYVLLGASGALSAVFGAFGRLYPRERIQLWIFVPLPAAPAVYYVLGFILVQTFFSLLPAGPLGGVAWEAHVIGLAFGFAAAPLVMRVRVKKRAEHVALVAAASLEPLATTRELRQILENLRAADLPEVRAAWVEKFAATAKCPNCGGPLRLRRHGMTSTCGWRLGF